MAKIIPEKTLEPGAKKEALEPQVTRISTQPGVYLFKNGQGRILYVGKARNLKKRVQTYFQKGRPHDAKTSILISKVVSVETIITRTEKEALILESNLIKRHRPRYNVVLKDDKRYPSLRLEMNQPFPNLTIVRKIQNDGNLYFGPYASAGAVRQTLKFIHKTFKLRKCRNKMFMSRTRPCLNYQMGLCLGPCCREVDPEEYRAVVNEVIAFLRGRTPELIRKVKKQMQAAAEEQAFEKAAALRDKMYALEKTLEQQVTVTSDFKDRDVIGMVCEDGMTAAVLFRVRGGFLMGSRQYTFDTVVGSLEEQMGMILHQLYASGQRIPAQILVSHTPDGVALLETRFSELRGTRVHILSPRRGEKARLLQMAVQNAQKALNEKIEADAVNLHLLGRLQKRLNMDRSPRRIECFDNSNLAGTNPVAAMAVFEMGKPRPDAYRRYKLRLNGKPDDYAYMAEVLQRRFGKTQNELPWPDLLLLDGGKGQLNVALAVLDALNIKGRFSVAGIAKKDEASGETADKIYLPSRANPVQFGRDADLLLFMQRIRDEAHRLAVTYQRRRRRARSLQSELDAIPGIGPHKKALLLKKFGSVGKIQAASDEDLSEISGISMKLARTIKLTLDVGKD